MDTKILIIDHNDSFTFNLVQLLEQAGGVQVTVVQSADELPVELLSGYGGLVLSPGPGLPGDYPGVAALLAHCISGVRKVPVLGICLGLQAIAVYFGGRLLHLGTVQHGTRVAILAVPGSDCPLFSGLHFPLQVGRYHSWAMDPAACPPELQMTTTAFKKDGDLPENEAPSDQDKIVMSIRHRELPVFGLQFHPESYMTPEGPAMIENWLAVVRNCSSEEDAGTGEIAVKHA